MKLKIMILSIKNILFFLIVLLAVNCSATDDFVHTLALAKHSSCSYIAEKFDALSRFDGFGNFVLKELKKNNEGLFPWRFEVTNGYQEGFFYFALLGYANELSGDIPFAYHCYQNSLACIDEDKSFSHPLPRAEIYLAIGRTCLAAGRYMDSKDWLDNAYFEAGDNKQLQAAIDRVLIQRANEIGDYPEIIFLYQHLENLANQKTPRLDKEGCPKGGVVERTTDYGPRVTGLTKPEIANYAQILFWCRKDREGFSKLLTGISKLGIDNSLGVKDPLVDKFLNNIMRAEDDEVKWFYDLLGWAIVDARAKAGDEDFLAFLCNARTLFCKVYDFLDPEDDLEKVKKRIDVVKQQIAQGYDVFGNKTKQPRHSPGATRNRKIVKLSNRKIINGEVQESPDFELEILLMQADWYYKSKKYLLAKVMYIKAAALATGTYANLEYDGTTMENAAVIGLLMINPKSKIEHSKFFDGSYRAAETTLQLYLAATNDEQRAKYDAEVAMKILPKANINVQLYLQLRIKQLCKDKEFADAQKLCFEYYNKTGVFPLSIGEIVVAIHIANGKTHEAFEAAYKTLLYPSVNISYNHWRFIEKIWSGALDNELLEYSRMRICYAMIDYIRFPNNNIARLYFLDACKWKQTYLKKEINLRKNIASNNNINSLKILENEFPNSRQYSHIYNKAIILLNTGKTNDACLALINAYRLRYDLCYEVCQGIINHDLELSIINKCLSKINNKTHFKLIEVILEKFNKINTNNTEVLKKILSKPKLII